MLKRRGVALSTATLGTALAGEAVTAAPAGLAAGIVGTVLAGATAAGTGAMTTLTKVLIMTKTKVAVFGAVLFGAVAAPWVVQHQTQVRLQAQNGSLQQQLDQLGQVNVENERLSNLVAQASSGQSFTEEQMRDLLRLRGEVGRLRQENKELDRLRDENRRLHDSQAQSTPVEGAVNPPGTAKPMRLYTRLIKVNAEALLSSMGSSSTAVDGNRKYFKDLGVEIEPPASVFIDKTNGTILVHASLENLDKIEGILSTLGLNDQKR
jgi:TolA-binding protein